MNRLNAYLVILVSAAPRSTNEPNALPIKQETLATIDIGAGKFGLTATFGAYGERQRHFYTFSTTTCVPLPNLTRRV